MKDHRVLEQPMRKKFTYFRNRELYSEAEEIEFGNYSTYNVLYTTGIGTWVRVFYGYNQNVLFALELAWKSTWAKLGLKHGERMHTDSLLLRLIAGKRLFGTEKVVLKTDTGKFDEMYKYEYEAIQWIKDTVAYWTYEFIETKKPQSWTSSGLHDWVLDRAQNPRSLITIDTPDFTEYYRQQEIWDHNHWKLWKEYDERKGVTDGV